MWWWEYVVITGLLLFGIYVFVMGTGYLPMILGHENNPTADSMERYSKPHMIEKKNSPRAASNALS